MTGSTLFVVATPIGNLDDLSPRARQVLDQADLIASEDTRHTRRLLSHFGIKTPQIALHEHNEEKIVGKIIDKLETGHTVALVSDAGTPLISDPGYRLLRAAHARGIRVSPVAGPSAATAALSVAGLATDRFCFEGYLPAKKPARQKRLRELAAEERTIILFEAVHRIAASLNDLLQIFGSERQAFIGREMTKLHEQCVCGSLADLKRMLDDGQIASRGEFVLAIEGQAAAQAAAVAVDLNQLIRELAAELPGSRAADIVARITGRKRNEIYRRMLKQRGDTGAG